MVRSYSQGSPLITVQPQSHQVRPNHTCYPAVIFQYCQDTHQVFLTTKSATVEIGFHNVNTGINYVIYYGTSSSGTKYYAPNSTATGYYYLIHRTSGTITINSVTITL